MKRIKIVLGIVVLAALLFPLANIIGDTPGAGALTKNAGDGDFAAVAGVLDTSCTGCHAADADLPFYARFPVANGMVREDVRRGLRHLDMGEAFAKAATEPPNEAALAKLEYATTRDSMPPGRYLALHWGKGLSDSDRETILGWLRKVRSENYSAPGVPTDLRAAILQPLPPVPKLDAAKVALGKTLFHDVRLSGDDTISCATCHDLAKGGTDQAKFSTGIEGQMGDINSPTVYNAGLQILQFWDGRADDLEAQAHGPVANPIEMGSNWQQVIAKLSTDAELTEEFTAAYADGWTGDNIANAIATFEATLVTRNSKFDKYLLLGEAAALSEAEKSGHATFEGAGCSTCHVGMAVGGRSFEYFGAERDYFAGRDNLKGRDDGRFNVTKKAQDKHRFKVPMLRNVAVTFPYMHDGSAATLEQAVKLMSDHQLEHALSDAEVKDVVAFLGTLTGKYEGKVLQ